MAQAGRGRGSHVSSYEAVLVRLEKQFSLGQEQLQRLVRHLVKQFRHGLSSDDHILKMVPTYVTELPSGKEQGSFMALDVGGSNFRVCEFILEGNGVVRSNQRKYVISDVLKNSPVETLFDFFAECVETFLVEIKAKGSDYPMPTELGFTFSFPVHQTALDAGTLVQWNKGFTCPGAIGQDVTQLLRDAFTRRNIVMNVTALVNDTTGTLMAHAYTNPETYVAVILGTGTNAAYVEKLSHVPKCVLAGDGGPATPEYMIINTEWGAYDEETVLPITSYDQTLDRNSTNPKSQILEKMMSGMYLGEIVRLVIVDLISTGHLFHGVSLPALAVPFSFETANLSRIERDHAIDLSDTRTVLETLYKASNTTLQDRQIVKLVCELVGKRSARLAAAGIAAVVTKMNRFNGCTVAIDGSLFEHYPHYANRMQDTLREILGIAAENIVLEQSRDGSGKGAAIIAAVHSLKKGVLA
ncbi:hypothetical protein CXG81DRAFT_29279 [Caulochytrium protostelioides]|uniref:Phosphotransferase n=1 Tax=Caulochytrium protostelioides TaxID=1555241 RepID=A0A4P9WU68_9FUNG|nr:hypothetical protein CAUPRSCDRAFT_10000 [Caulochytrium protostelioides]RKP03438.1 hypothetical protein CXG81DRAFT_29279 [Caulochytrium protostelioides]|eukprot:RKP03438.1 hypothetical protein CXG81DRAFT_29279 [Caulochytrium protostelioides]